MSAAYALAPGSIETWNSGATEGWQHYYRTSMVVAPTYDALTVQSGSAVVKYGPYTGIDINELAKGVSADIAASDGAFVGDYWTAGVAYLKFRIYAEASAVPLEIVLRNTLGVEPQFLLRDLPVGEWVEVVVPMQFDAGWRQCNADSFQAALQNVTRVLIVPWRDQDHKDAHNFYVDDVEIEGVPVTVTLSGIATYDGEQPGALHVLATEQKYSWDLGKSAVAGAGGAYAIGQVPSLTEYWVKAFVDSNGNGTHDFWEAFGWYNAESPLARLLGDVAGVNVSLSDPATADGLPYWWLHEHFGITDPSTAAGELSMPAADADNDGDTMSNYAEYKAGTLPDDFASRFVVESLDQGDGMVLRWTPKTGATYSVWRADRPAGTYAQVNGSPVVGGEYVDATATGDGPYYYRVEVE